MSKTRSPTGTTLVEAVVAIGILAGAVTMLAGLVHSAVRTATIARERSTAAICALEKTEGLCRDARLLTVSPGGSLTADMPGFADYLDARGLPATGSSRIFVRRWSIAPVKADPDLLAIQVEVSPCRRAGVTGSCEAGAGGVRLASIRSRLTW